MPDHISSQTDEHGDTQTTHSCVMTTVDIGNLINLYAEKHMKKAIKESLARIHQVPTGTIITHGAAIPPPGYLECNGTIISRETYAELFAVIGTTYGRGNGSTTFTLPDLRGEFIRGWDDGRGIDADRMIGSWQHASHIPHDEDAQHLHCIADRASALSHGLEQPTYTDIKKQLFVSWAGGSVPLDRPNVANIFYAAVRSRNIALMFCIKY